MLWPASNSSGGSANFGAVAQRGEHQVAIERRRGRVGDQVVDVELVQRRARGAGPVVSIGVSTVKLTSTNRVGRLTVTVSDVSTVVPNVIACGKPGRPARGRWRARGRRTGSSRRTA